MAYRSWEERELLPSLGLGPDPRIVPIGHPSTANAAPLLAPADLEAGTPGAFSPQLVTLLIRDRDELLAALEEAVTEADRLTMEYHWSPEDDQRQARHRAIIARIKATR